MAFFPNEQTSASLSNWGYLFDPGKVRTSATRLILFSSSNEMKTLISRVEWPIVQMSFFSGVGFGPRIIIVDLAYSVTAPSDWRDHYESISTYAAGPNRAIDSGNISRADLCHVDR